MSPPPELLFRDAGLMLPAGGPAGGWLAVSGGRIAGLGRGPAPAGLATGAAMVVDARGLYLLPGFIDLHLHGAVGVDAMDGDPDGLRRVARFYAAHGVTAWLPTTWTGSEAVTLRALEAIAATAGPVDGGATILGAHMEGPYLSVARCGAQDVSLIRPAARREACRFLDTGVVRLLALAPEVEENRWLIGECRRRGITVAAGHTDATYEQAVRAVRDGVRQVTHTFNAMRAFGHREPGLLGAALTMPQLTCELVADNVHVQPAAMRVLAELKGVDGVILVSDAVRATGLSDGGYDLGGRAAVRSDGAIRLADGTLAGSVLTLDRALRNYRDAGGLTLAAAWPASSRNAARAIGVDGSKGSLELGKDADLVLLDEALGVVATVAEGTVVHGAERLAALVAGNGHRAAGRGPGAGEPTAGTGPGAQSR